MIIESLKNEKIKNLTRLISKNNERKKNKIFIVEGKQENQRAIKYGYQSIEFYIAPEIYKDELPNQKVNLVSNQVYNKLAYRGSSEGILGIYKEKNNDLLNFKPKQNSSIILVESVEKPGNLGAILRSCEAFGIDAIIVTDNKLDFYNPNVIRSSVGCLFGMNFFQTTNKIALDFFNQNHYQIITTFMDNEEEKINHINMKKNTVVCFGTEHSGLSDFWRGKGSNALIPTIGSIDSLNLSNAVAITCYELLTQKSK